jgi:SAM-dependent methyltransferase
MKKKLSDISEIDWNEVILAKKEDKQRSIRDGSEYWNKRAPSFVEHASKTIYPDSFIKIMNPHRSWSVFDMGCGGGTLAIPLASKVKHITAVDFSDKMLEKLQTEANSKKIRNITTIKASWVDDWSKAGIGIHDIAIASRSLTVNDVQTAMQKLNDIARKLVYVSTVVGDGPHDRNIFEAIGRKFNPSVDYIYIYNLLFQMGIHANINFIENEKEKKFINHEEAFNSYLWMFQDLTVTEVKQLKEYLRKHLIKFDGKWMLDYKRIIKWAVIWWDKNDQCG